jgi:type IV pilus assembly protein PilA
MRVERTPGAARGFTFIELAMILAATAVVAAVGVSAYRTYAVRAQIAASVTVTTPLRQAIDHAFRRSGLPPVDRSSPALAHANDIELGDYLESIIVANGRIELTFGGDSDEAIAGRTLSLTPFETADLRVVWICGNEIPGVGLKPLGFAGGANQATQVLTAIEARYLPATCR